MIVSLFTKPDNLITAIGSFYLASSLLFLMSNTIYFIFEFILGKSEDYKLTTIIREFKK